MERYAITFNATNNVVCTDNAHDIVCTFEPSKFNETQRFDFDPQFAVGKTPQEVAHIVNEMAMWLRTHNYSLAMGAVDNTRLRIAAKLRELRIIEGISQADLADRASIPRSHLSRIEAGKYNITIDILERLAQGLGYTIDFVKNVDN